MRKATRSVAREANIVISPNSKHTAEGSPAKHAGPGAQRVGVIGTGYVGLVAGACFADTGNHVICADVDVAKVARLNAGEIPIYEPGLDVLVDRNARDGRLAFTTDVARTVRESDIIFIAVGTPPGEDGSADLKFVLQVARTIGQAMNGEKVVVTKSTVPVGTAAKVRAAVMEHAAYPVHVCSNPEFLKEGAAIEDFMRPDRVVVGADSDHARHALGQLYAPFVRSGKPILFMDIASAEITKYAANAMLAARISFMNTMAALCEAVGADVNEVRAGIGSDTRIGPSFLYAGCGYGGSCFPKDVKALIRTLGEHDVNPAILSAVEEVNEAQKEKSLADVESRYGQELAGRTFAVWGLSFKPETDDMREAPSLKVIEGLLRRGAQVKAHDPEAMEAARQHYFGDRIQYCSGNYEALEGSDALVILTEWAQYRQPDFDRIRSMLAEPVIFDGRNLFHPASMAEAGFEYRSIGRPAVSGAAALFAG
jgi:UDPglucose 6-dehydrogenase